MPPTVSVILPTFNRSDSLINACRSVLDQSFTDLELIVVDDGSTVDIQAALRPLDDARVVYHRQDPNAGASAARNAGLRLARGEFIAFQDSDDLWLPGKLDKQLAQLRNLPDEVGAVSGGKVLYGCDDARNCGVGKVTYAPDPSRPLSLEEDQVKRFLLENRISLQNTLFRRTCFPDDQWFNPAAKANADWEFTIRLVQHTKVFEDPDPVVFSYISTDSISRNPKKRLRGQLRIFKKNRHLYDQHRFESAQMRFKIGSILYNVGKKKIGRKLILSSLMLNPGNLRRTFRFVKHRIQRVSG